MVCWVGTHAETGRAGGERTLAEPVPVPSEAAGSERAVRSLLVSRILNYAIRNYSLHT